MSVIAFIAAFLLAPGPVTLAPVCSGPAPALVGAHATLGSSDSQGLNRYVITISVANTGGSGQRSNVLQSVAIYQDSQKVDQKGIPPLAAGQTYRFTHVYLRNADARPGSTRFDFRLFPNRMTGWANCGSGGSRYTLTF